MTTEEVTKARLAQMKRAREKRKPDASAGGSRPRVHGNGNRKDVGQREQLFIAEYLKDFNATRAAKAAGYSEKTAHVTGHKLLNKGNIKEQVNAKCKEILDQSNEAAARIIKEYERLAFADMKDFVENSGDHVVVRNLEDVDGRIIQSIESHPVVNNRDGIVGHAVKIKLHDKKGALDALAKYRKLLSDTEVKTEIHIHIDEDDERL